MAAQQLETRNQPRKSSPALGRSSCGTHGSSTPNAIHDTMCKDAASTVSVFGGFQCARNEATKICKKFPTKGIALISPIITFGIGYAFATSAVMNTFTGRDIVTSGIAMMPSAVHNRNDRTRSAFLWAGVGALVAFKW